MVEVVVGDQSGEVGEGVARWGAEGEEEEPRTAEEAD